MKITVSAPGKILLIGEHTAVYGKPALLSSIDKRIYIQASIVKNKKNNKNQELKIEGAKDARLIKKTTKIFKDHFSIKRIQNMHIKVSSSIPIGAGLGSSAALSAAVSAVLMKLVKDVWNPLLINKLAYKAEKYSHGNPSGADNSAVVLGGLIWFRKEFDFLRSIWKLPLDRYKIPGFFLVDSGIPVETTKEMVERVKKLRKRDKKKFESILQDQERLTKQFLLSLRRHDMSDLSESIRKAQRNLEMLDIVGKKAKTIIKSLEKAGFSAKICGAGGVKKGSGMILCLAKNQKAFGKTAKELSLLSEPLRFTDQGVRIEEKINERQTI